MGSAARPRPQRLAAKLLQIRLAPSLSQSEMVEALDLSDALFRSNISKYELGTGEPSLPVLLRYARLANVQMEALVDDALDLPPRLPSRTKHAGLPRVPEPDAEPDRDPI